MVSEWPLRPPADRCPSAATASRRRGLAGDLRYGDSGAVAGWEQLCSQAPGPALTAWTALRTDPRARSQRQHPLKGDFATRSIGGRLLDQWQYEITGAGRIWYCIGDDRRLVHLTFASVFSPSADETGLAFGLLDPEHPTLLVFAGEREPEERAGVGTSARRQEPGGLLEEAGRIGAQLRE